MLFCGQILPSRTIFDGKPQTMYSVDLLEEAIDLAKANGFEVRQWLGESGGGACRIGSKWVLFINLTLTAQEQLQNVVLALRGTGVLLDSSKCSSQLRAMLPPAAQHALDRQDLVTSL